MCPRVTDSCVISHIFEEIIKIFSYSDETYSIDPYLTLLSNGASLTSAFHLVLFSKLIAHSCFIDAFICQNTIAKIRKDATEALSVENTCQRLVKIRQRDIHFLLKI